MYTFPFGNADVAILAVSCGISHSDFGCTLIYVPPVVLRLPVSVLDSYCQCSHYFT